MCESVRSVCCTARQFPSRPAYKRALIGFCALGEVLGKFRRLLRRARLERIRPRAPTVSQSATLPYSSHRRPRLLVNRNAFETSARWASESAASADCPRLLKHSSRLQERHGKIGNADGLPPARCRAPVTNYKHAQLGRKSAELATDDPHCAVAGVLVCNNWATSLLIPCGARASQLVVGRGTAAVLCNRVDEGSTAPQPTSETQCARALGPRCHITSHHTTLHLTLPADCSVLI